MDKDDSLTPNPNTDLAVKYQKLAAEYAKIRAQLNVLKRGILDEQSKNAALKDELNERDKTIRKYEQEIDSYSFRNQQLEKRVGVLQGDLTEKGKKGNKKQSGADVRRNEPDQMGSSSNSVPLNELLTKIDENVQLTRQMSQQDDNFKKQINELINSYEDKLKTATSHNQALFIEFETENTSLTHLLQEANEEVKVARSKTCDLEERLNNFSTGQVLRSEISSDIPEFLPLSIEPQASTKSPCDLISKLIKSQQETEYWKLEYELNKMKHSKTLLKYEECRKHLKSLGRDDLLLEVNEVTTPDSTVTTMIGKMEITAVEDLDLGSTYEKDLINYFTRRVNELIHLLQLCDRKAITFYDECNSLQTHLVLAVEERNSLQVSFNELQSTHATLSEELQLITNTYEAQVLTLTEHIANMNDKLTSQTDTIGLLEFQLKHGSKKK